MAADPIPVLERHAQIVHSEQGLARKLSERQMSMIAIGGAIGTGLFLGSALAVRTAGPGVILSYIFAAVVALLLMYCLCEMAVAHPTAGSFGVYADLYISPWAGFVVRYTYWAAQCHRHRRRGRGGGNLHALVVSGHVQRGCGSSSMRRF